MLSNQNVSAEKLNSSKLSTFEKIKQKVEKSHFRSDHRAYLQGEFWRDIPGYSEITSEQFLDAKWQTAQTLTRAEKLKTVLANRISDEFLEEVQKGFALAPMAMRVTPYMLALMNWEDPENCPVRKQLLPFAPHAEHEHPMQKLDSLNEQGDSPVTGLIHRYPDKVLFLPLKVCPVYCRYCTRSYAVGTSTATVEKSSVAGNSKLWQQAFDYIADHPQIEDIVISGGDAFFLKPQQIETIGFSLLDIPHVKRIRLATRGLSVMPQKVLTDQPWFDAVAKVNAHGRKLFKEVAIHTHFSHPREVTWITEQASRKLFAEGIKVRNQSVLLRGINDDVDTMVTLVKRLSYINIQPYYVYLCDMMNGVEDMRTGVQAAIELEKHVRGITAGFNTPTFVCDAPGGGGKRCLHSFEHYNPETGIAVYTAPSVKKDEHFLYFDPLHCLSPEVAKRWEVPAEREKMISEARFHAGVTLGKA